MATLTMPEIQLPTEGSGNWGTQFNAAITVIRNALQGLSYAKPGDVSAVLDALNAHSHPEFTNIASAITTINSTLSTINSALANKAESEHQHSISDIEDFNNLFVDVKALPIVSGVSGVDFYSPNVVLNLGIANVPIVKWKVGVYWNSQTLGEILTSTASRIVIPKPGADSSIWTNKKATLQLSITAINPFNSTETDTPQTESVEVTMFNFITVQDLKAALVADSTFRSAIVDDMASKVVAEVYAAQQA